MCILIIKPKGKKCPSKEILEECYNNNPDGAGICYNDKNSVFIRKGFMNFKEFLKEVRSIPKNSTALIHCRIGTSGKNSKELTHPYKLCDSYKEMRLIRTQLKGGDHKEFAVAHNGIFSGLGLESEICDMVNDTCVFIKKFLSPLNYNNNILENNFDDIIETCVDGSRLAIIDNEGNYKKYGSGWIEEADGCFYSNSSYKKVEHFFSYSDFLDNYYDAKKLKEEYPKYSKDIEYYSRCGVPSFTIRNYIENGYFDEEDILWR